MLTGSNPEEVDAAMVAEDKSVALDGGLNSNLGFSGSSIVGRSLCDGHIPPGWLLAF